MSDKSDNLTELFVKKSKSLQAERKSLVQKAKENFLFISELFDSNEARKFLEVNRVIMVGKVTVAVNRVIMVEKATVALMRGSKEVSVSGFWNFKGIEANDSDLVDLKNLANVNQSKFVEDLRDKLQITEK